jgi:hypothetical protein
MSKMVATKVRVDTYLELERIAREKNTTVYALLKEIIETLVENGMVSIEELTGKPKPASTGGPKELDMVLGKLTKLERKIVELEARLAELKSRLEEAEPKKREEDWKIVLKPSRK